MNLEAGSSIRSRPCSASFRIAAAVNCLVIDPMRKRVSGSNPASSPPRLASPYPFSKTISPFRATKTSPPGVSPCTLLARSTSTCISRSAGAAKACDCGESRITASMISVEGHDHSGSGNASCKLKGEPRRVFPQHTQTSALAFTLPVEIGLGWYRKTGRTVLTVRMVIRLVGWPCPAIPSIFLDGPTASRSTVLIDYAYSKSLSQIAIAAAPTR